MVMPTAPLSDVPAQEKRVSFHGRSTGQSAARHRTAHRAGKPGLGGTALFAAYTLHTWGSSASVWNQAVRLQKLGRKFEFRQPPHLCQALSPSRSQSGVVVLTRIFDDMISSRHRAICSMSRSGAAALTSSCGSLS